MIVLNQFHALALTLLKKVNKPARKLWEPLKVKAWDLTRHQWEVLTAMQGLMLEGTETSAVNCGPWEAEL